MKLISLSNFILEVEIGNCKVEIEALKVKYKKENSEKHHLQKEIEEANLTNEIQITGLGVLKKHLDLQLNDLRR